jgi:transcriptional regulator
MYIPAHFRQHDREAAIAFMKAHSFAVIVSSVDGVPVATHLPFHIETSGEEIILTAHFARANPQWKSLKEVLVIFNGPHAYISPAHYERDQNVPTWNFIAVHAYGSAELVTDEAAGLSILEDLIRQSEPEYLSQWAGLSQEYRMGLFKGIVPFRLIINRLDAKEKLSQNKTAQERRNIITALQQADDGLAQELAAYMRDREE